MRELNISSTEGAILLALFLKLDIIICNLILWFLNNTALKTQRYNKNTFIYQLLLET